MPPAWAAQGPRTGRAGDADLAITLRVYLHVLEDQASGAATTFELPTGEPTNEPGSSRLDQPARPVVTR